jgi:hypothetical protein
MFQLTVLTTTLTLDKIQALTVLNLWRIRIDKHVGVSVSVLRRHLGYAFI